MPKLFPNVSAQTVRPTGPNPLLDPNARSAEFAAIGRAGQALSQAGNIVGQFALQKQQKINEFEQQKQQKINEFEQQKQQKINEFEQQKQEHLNKGALAEQEANRIDFDTQMQVFMDKNQDDIRSWSLERQRMSSQLDSTSEKALEGFDIDVKNTNELAKDDWKADSDAKFAVIENRAKIAKSNAQIEGLADQLLRQGDHDGYVGVMKQRNATTQQTKDAILKGLSEGLYSMALDDLQQIGGISQTKEFVDYVNEKDADGNFANMEFGEGGISFRGRSNLKTLANAKIVRLEKDRTRNEKEIDGRINRGEAGIKDLEDLSSTDGLGSISREYADSKIEQLSREDTFEKINRGDQLESYNAIKDSMSLNSLIAKFGPPQPTDKKYKKILNSIDSSELSFELKNELMNQWLDLKAIDLSNYVEEGTNWFWNRDFKQPEKNLRLDLIQVYRDLLPDYGMFEVAKMSLNHEKQIREFFDDNEDATNADAKAFMKEKVVNPMVLELMAGSLINSTVDFGNFNFDDGELDLTK